MKSARVSRFTVDTFDPSLRKQARWLPKGYSLHHGLTVPRALMGLAARLARLADVPEVTVNSDVSVRIHRPPGYQEPGPAMLWIHGGGKCMGSAAQEDKHCRQFANFTDVAVVAVDHRLAPEHPYPTPVEDCYAALMWLARQPWVDPTRVAVGGASGGGGLAAALAQLARDRGEITVALQLLVYPMIDDRTSAAPDSDSTVRVLWSARDNRIAWAWYLKDADPEVAVPARRTDLTGLPPAWIGVGTEDLFYDECMTYAQRLREAGVPVHLEVAQDAFHGFDFAAPNSSVTQRFVASRHRALREALVTRPWTGG